MKYYLKLDGENIVGHDYQLDEIHTVEVEADVLIDFDTCGYKYKCVDGELVELSQEEKDSHPLMVARQHVADLDQAVERARADILTKSFDQLSVEQKKIIMNMDLSDEDREQILIDFPEGE